MEPTLVEGDAGAVHGARRHEGGEERRIHRRSAGADPQLGPTCQEQRAGDAGDDRLDGHVLAVVAAIGAGFALTLRRLARVST